MPPKQASINAEGVPALTDSELKLVRAVMSCFNGIPDVDFEKVAGLAGLANARSAKDRFRQVSKKHGWGDPDAAGSGATTPPKASGGRKALAAQKTGKVAKKRTPKKPTARKKKADRADSDDDEDIEAKLESDSDGKTMADAQLDSSSSSDGE
ncbi:hypothetical protein CTRI78_v000510 [Colletotrichum trifolii]|uniref:Uncharacterized protein n=1 Tax=Colletotrichum trifolii TaxID=5466 RepID=A0A4R8RSK0_COLTR|nr:hypothetical protein CTRI78_v000510 [Colletotrichum trifolii]